MYYFALIALLTLAAGVANARDVHVNGYYRSNGTYVAPHVRSSPDGSRANNYGPSRSGSGYASYGYGTLTWSRDSDHDGIANEFDLDDNNDGIGDDHE